MTSSDAEGHEETAVSNSGAIAHGGTLIQAGHIGVMNVHGVERPVDVPRELPPPNVRWTNRTGELAKLGTAVESALAGTGPKIIVVTGDAAIGRTDLVSRCEESLRGLFPDGTLYCDLNKHRSAAGGVDISGALTDLTAGVENPSWWPASAPAQAKRWQAIAAKKRLLAVIDNLDDPPLLRHLAATGDGTVTIVIFRYNAFEFELAGADVIPIERLPDTHAIDVLASWSPGDPRFLTDDDGIVQRLVRLCDGRPRLLHMLGKIIASMPGIALATVTDQVLGGVDTPHSLSAVTTSLVECIVENLPDDERALLGRLASHPGNDFSRELVHALGAHHMTATTLAELGLIVPTGIDRWHIPNAIARHCDSDGDINDIATFYLATARHCDQISLGDNRLRLTDGITPPPSPPAALAKRHPDAKRNATTWLSIERHNLAAIAQHLFDLGRFQEVWGLEQSMWALYRAHMPLQYWRENAERAVQAAMLHGDAAAEARMRAQYMDVLMRLGQTDDAQREITHAITLAQQADNRRLEASCVEFSGILARRLGDHAAAITAFHFALHVNTTLRHERAIGMLNRLIAETHMDLGEHDGARRHLTRATTIFQEDPGSHHWARTLAAAARLAAMDADEEQLDTAVQDAVDAAITTDTPRAIPEIYESCGQSMHHRGFRAVARRYWTAALDAHTAHGDDNTDAVTRLQAALAELE